MYSSKDKQPNGRSITEVSPILPSSSQCFVCFLGIPFLLLYGKGHIATARRRRQGRSGLRFRSASWAARANHSAW
ncbi:hypothetical protein BR93DRAFT_922248 [Coniochaeta sp. PMI_546]|nr:hypothetical protein BR93DRAFT_922248 [Coniochaeta sp. PMI_546]